MAVGVAGNASLASGLPVRVRELDFGAAGAALEPVAVASASAS
jgi:hypothetical protein